MRTEVPSGHEHPTLTGQSRLTFLRRHAFNCKDAGGRIFIANGLGVFAAWRVPPRLRFIHAGELKHHHARCRGRTLKSYRVSAAYGVPAKGQRGNTSEDDADEASYGQHENRCDAEKPKHPKLPSILIGALIVAA